MLQCSQLFLIVHAKENSCSAKVTYTNNYNHSKAALKKKKTLFICSGLKLLLNKIEK